VAFSGRQSEYYDFSLEMFLELTMCTNGVFSSVSLYDCCLRSRIEATITSCFKSERSFSCENN